VKLKKIIALVLLAFAGFSILGFAADKPQSLGKVDEQRLIGRWVRPDGGYAIDVRSVQAGGNLDVAYFNPNPIHVSRTEWRKEGDILTVFVELNDKNYPGATYKLRYYPDSEQLAGTYTQPLVQQTFDVYFVRAPKAVEEKV